MAIGYTPTTWIDNDTLVDAARLNNIETGVQAACDELDEFYDSSTKAITAPGDVNIQELGANINIGSPSIWVGLDAYLNSLRLQSLNLLELIAGDAFQSLASQFALKNYGGDIIIQNFDNSAQVHGDIKLVTDGQALYNGVEIATKAKVGEVGADLNTLTAEGMYQIQNPNNAPTGVTGWVTLSVIPTSNDNTYCRQMLYIPSSDDIYTRNNAGGTWGAWNKLALKSDFANTTALTATPDTYISSGTITYIQVGKMVFFTASYTMLANISNSTTFTLDSDMPAPLGSIHLQFDDHVNAYTYDNVVRSFGISGTGSVYLKGPHSAGTAYSCSGSYICN